ncbi:MAG: hypothetical protein IKN78_08030 [Bacteroidales bacterium]|nr:hypothetical protein [Bacteroidales bacterium]
MKLFIFAYHLIDYKYVKNKNRQIQNHFRFCKKSDGNSHFQAKQFNNRESHQKSKAMKKLIITPQKDTMTICLPQEWVGRPLVCILRHPEEKSAYPLESEFISELREESLGYNIRHYRQVRRPRKKRLRRKSGGRNRLL